MEREGIGVEVVDLRTVLPLDLETIEKSISKTQRYVVMHEARETEGVGPQIIYQIGKHGIDNYVRIPSENRLLSAAEVPVPSVEKLVWDRLPYEREEFFDQDEKGRDIRRRIVRSPKLAEIIRKNMDY